MNVGMMQPTFLPWPGYFELIYKSEVFVFLDDFQFSVQSYHQRNRLFVNKGQADWYTVPVRKSSSFQMPLNKTQIKEDTPWRTKLWKRIEQNYGKAKYFKAYKETIKNWLLSPAQNLAEQNIIFIKMMCDILGFKTTFYQSSGYPSQRQRSERVVELLRWCNSHCYHCAKGSFDYMFQDKVFPVDDIVILFQDHHPKQYQQIGSPDEFVPFLSILDTLFNVGPAETTLLVKDGTSEWHTWETMVSLRAKEARNENEYYN